MVSRHPWSLELWTQLPPDVWASVWYQGAWGQLWLPSWMYSALGALMAPLAVATIAALLWRPERLHRVGVRRREAALLLATVALVYIGLWYSALSIQQWQGRYLFPALAGLAAIPVLGVVVILPTRLRVPALAVLPAVSLAVDLAALTVSMATFQGR